MRPDVDLTPPRDCPDWFEVSMAIDRSPAPQYTVVGGEFSALSGCWDGDGV